jgi:hypothetical protein
LAQSLSQTFCVFIPLFYIQLSLKEKYFCSGIIVHTFINSSFVLSLQIFKPSVSFITLMKLLFGNISVYSLNVKGDKLSVIIDGHFIQVVYQISSVLTLKSYGRGIYCECFLTNDWASLYLVAFYQLTVGLLGMSG